MKLERKLWMTPRCKRHMPVWKIIELLNIFQQASLDGEWDSNVRKLLSDKGLKKDYASYDKNPGGDRTYLAQLICLGFIYQDINKEIKLTKAARDLLSGHNEPLKIYRKMLLKQQYPSLYSLGHNVAISEQVVIRPYTFLLSIMQKLEEIKNGDGYLNNEEMALCVIYGNTKSDIDICIKKIQNYRKGIPYFDLIDNPSDTWTTRMADNSLESRALEVLNIANTFDNLMDSAKLIIRSKVNGVTRSYLNNDIVMLLEESKKQDFIFTTKKEIKENKISFQRKFGAWEGKDTASTKGNYVQKLTAAQTILRNKYIELLASKLIEDTDIDGFKKDMLNLGFSTSDVELTIKKYSNQNTSLFEDKYIALSTGGALKGLSFEVATHHLFEKIGIKAELTGQLKRPKGKPGSYTDIVLTNNKKAIIIDTKASGKYDLPHTDHAKACLTYIPNWEELKSVHNKTDADFLEGMCYIAGDFILEKNLNPKLLNINIETKKHITAIKAMDFYKYIQKNPNAGANDFFNKLRDNKLIELN